MRRLLLFFLLNAPLSFLLAQGYDLFEQRNFVEDMRIINNGGKYGFVNRKYIQVIPPVYLDAKDFSEGLAAVQMNDSAGTAMWTFIDKTGKQAVDGRYEAIEHSFRYGLAAVRNNGKILVIDKEGKLVVLADEKWELPFRHGLVKVKNNDLKFGVANLKGKLVVPVEFDEVKIWSPNFVGVGINKNYALLDSNGRIIVEPKYNDMGLFNEGMLPVRKGDKWGYINEEGKEVVPMLYDEADLFVDGKAWVSLNKEGFYIDKIGKPMIREAGQSSNPKSLTKKSPEKEFLDLLNELVTTYPYINKGFESLVDSPFVIRNGILVGVLRTYSPDGPVLNKLSVPVVKLKYVWHDYHFGFEFDEKVAVIQLTQPNEKVFGKAEKTDILYLATPGDGPSEVLTEKVTMAIKALQRSYLKKPVSGK